MQSSKSKSKILFELLQKGTILSSILNNLETRNNILLCGVNKKLRTLVFQYTKSLTTKFLINNYDIRLFTKCLSQYLNLNSLDISSLKINYCDKYKQIFDIVNKMRKLRKIDLSHNYLGDLGDLAHCLSNMPDLEAIILQHIVGNGCVWKLYGVTEFASSLGNLTCLKSLDLTGNHIGTDVLNELAPVLKQLLQLQDIKLSENNLGPKEAPVLADIFKQLPQLTKIDLSHNHIGFEGVCQLVNSFISLPQLCYVNLSLNRVYTRPI